MTALKYHTVLRSFGPEKAYEAGNGYALVVTTTERAGYVLPTWIAEARLGYYLASRGHDTRAIQAYLGHASITHTVRHTEMSPERF